MDVVQILIYACFMIFIATVATRVIRYKATPVHLRWELYPVPHEKGRAEHGGSIFEELDWWKKTRDTDLINELKEMFQEIVFLKGIYHHNRSLWVFSFPFHFGLYLAVFWIVLLVLMSILAPADLSNASGIFVALQYLAMATGYTGLGLTILGALGLLYRRFNDPNIRKYSVRVEYLNLIFILVFAGMALSVHLAADPSFSNLTRYLSGVISLNKPPSIALGIQVELVLAALLIAYIPMSRMGHFIAKYFLYHDVRWSDEANLPGSDIEKKVIKQLGGSVDWAGSHIQTGKTWIEVGTEMPGGEDKKR